MSRIEEILEKAIFTKDDLLYLLNSADKERLSLFEKAKEVKAAFVGKKVYFRGLIEYSNYSKKNNPKILFENNILSYFVSVRFSWPL